MFNQGNQNPPDEVLINFSNLNLQNPIDSNDTANNPLSRVNYDQKPLEVKVRLAKNFQQTEVDNTYRTTSSKRGQILIINNEIFDKHLKRDGSEMDVKCLESLFKQMFFDVETHRNLSVTVSARLILNE